MIGTLISRTELAEIVIGAFRETIIPVSVETKVEILDAVAVKNFVGLRATPG